jgi:hypothetical protein
LTCWDWILVGIVAAAIGNLFGVDVPSPTSAAGDAVDFQTAPGPFILVGLPVDRRQDPRDPGPGRRHRPGAALCPGVHPRAGE